MSAKVLPPVRGRAPVHKGRLLAILLLSPFALGAAFLVRIAAVEAFEAEGPSMEPTLMNEERFAVDKSAFGLRLPGTASAQLSWGEPKPGDVVVLTSPRDHVSIVKRVVGLPGDVIEWREGDLVRNGQRLSLGRVACPEQLNAERPDLVCDAEAIAGRRYVVTYAADRFALSRPPVEIPEGHVYVVGDHRDRSNDSRTLGPISFALLIGRATFVYWSPAGSVRRVQ